MQQGGELAYLIRHDPEFRSVRREHLRGGRPARPAAQRTSRSWSTSSTQGIDGLRFSFFVISAAPREVIESALDGIVPADHIFGTELDYEPTTGEVRAIARVPAGYGKVAAVERARGAAGHRARSHRSTSATAARTCT